jgi:hypothetical protein
LLYAVSAPAATLFPTASTWRFLRGTNEASLPDTTLWRTNGFNDAAFANAPAPFWYGDVRPGGTQLTGMQSNFTCIFLRSEFVVTNLTEFCALQMSYFIDDGFVAWINGLEVLRINVGAGEVSTNTTAANQATDPAPLVSSILPAPSGYLRLGTNLLCVQVFNTSLTSSDLGFDCSLVTLVGETTPPTLSGFSPPAGNRTNLTEVTVTFSEPVTGVTADDLLLNTQPASSVSGSGTTYTFGFSQPNYGNVSITWFGSPGIVDLSQCANPFDGGAPGATWNYTLLDTIPPQVVNLFPAAGVEVRTLRQIEVTFSEEVNGVTADDLLINMQPATNVTRMPGGPYVFQFAEPATGVVQVAWAMVHGITDQATTPNAFGGGMWTLTLNPNAPEGDLVITEFLASNVSGLRDEDNQEQDWIEIYNRGGGPADLNGWSLSDDAGSPGLWTFGPRVLPAGQYLIVFCSGKDIRNPTGTNRHHTSFQLSGGGEFLGLYNADSPRVLISSFGAEYPEQRNDHSYGYDFQGNLRYFATPTPGMPNGNSTIVGVADGVHFSATRGHYSQAFDLALSTLTPNGIIRYTTDGSEPVASSPAYLNPLRITNNTRIRAAALRANFLPSRTETHSYFFNIPAAQRSIPMFAINTAVSNMIGRTGIIGMGGGSRAGDGLFITNNPATDYHNPSAHGIAWERPVSAEYILPADNSGFQIDCGIRVQGSDWQRPRTTPASKFSYRLYFRGDYGDGTLEYPLYPLTTVEAFDQVVMRAGFNDNNNPFIRDELTRRLSHDMGQVASHGGFAVLYTNGAYAGYYNPCERVNEEFMQSYLGGGGEWDVVGPDFAQSSEGPGIIDGDRQDFANLMTNVWGGVPVGLRPVTNDAKYLVMQQRLDLANFADYCLLNAYTAMGDWPANNWRAARERGNPNALWRFIVWDAEWGHGFSDHVTTTDSFALSGTGTLDAGLNSTGNSEIARLYQALRQNREWRLLWADRIHKHFFNGGALMTQSVTNRLQEMRNELQGLFTITDAEFLTWNHARIAPLFGQFNTYGLYGGSNALHGLFMSSNAPAFNQHGGRVASGFPLTMTAPAGGTIYYTTNGHDPRVPFSGAVSNAALTYAGAVTIDRTMPIKARTLHNGTNWSAVAEAVFEVAARGVPLRITEIHYRPLGDVNFGSATYEFIEFQNVGGSAIDLGGITVEDAQGVIFTFNLGGSLAPGARLVLGADDNPAAFAARYPGVAVHGYFSGNLNNGGERLTVRDAGGNVIQSVDYDNGGAWPEAADGLGSSLEIVDANGDPDDPANWRASAAVDGSPGAANPAPPVPMVLLNEVMAENLSAVNNAGTFPDWVELHNPGVAPVDLTGWSLTDDGNARKFVLPATNVAAGGFLVVWLDATTNTTPGLHAGFSLDRDGDNVFLYDAATNLVDALTLGLQLADYSVGRAAGDWVLNTATPGAANTAATLAPVSSLAINEWMANPVPGQDDWLELFNTSAAAPVALRGIYLGTSNATHRVTSLSFIAPLGYAQFFANEAIGPDRLDFRLPASGNAIVLCDMLAAEIQRVTYGAQSSGISQGRLPDGTSTLVTFPGTASPEAMNYQASYTGPVLNEVLARNQTAVTNAGRAPDYFEIHNPNAGSFSLAGMSLSVGGAEPGQWRFPPTATIGASSYLVIWCDGGLPASTNVGSFNTGRSLDGESDGVYLFNAAGQLVNSVEFGFQVADKSIGLSGGQWRLLNAPTPGATNGAVHALGPTNALRINEWMASPDRGDDWFELYNTNSALPVSLGGLFLTDDPSAAGQTNSAIAPLSFIGPAGFVKFVADGNADAGRNHVRFSLDGDGETLRLLSGTNALDTVVFGEQATGISEGRLLDGAANIVTFPGSASPGESNHRLLENAVIAELLTHTDTPQGDAIEIHNSSGADAAIGGWYLSNSRDNLKKFRIADGTMLPAGARLVFYQTQFGAGPDAFTLSSAYGDEAWLSAADGAGNLTGLRAGARFGPAANGVSFGRHVNSAGLVEHVAQSNLTLGLPNTGPLVGPVLLNEILYHGQEGTAGEDDEYVEVRNTGGTGVALFDPMATTNRWKLGGGIDYTFPAGFTLGGGSNVVVVNFDPANATLLNAFRLRYGVPASAPVFGPFGGGLNNGGDRVELLKPDPPQPPGNPDAGYVPYVLVEAVEYLDETPWPAGAVDGGGLSLQRRAGLPYANDPVSWVASAPTPGATNGAGVTPPATITQSPQSQSVLEDATVLFHVSASGDPLGYQWRFNGFNLAGATNGMLMIPFAELESAGQYDVIVSTPGGSAVSGSATLVVRAPPLVLLPPSSSTVSNSFNASFSVLARGTAPLGYQWRRNGANIAGANGATLNLTGVQFADDADYDCVITNGVGMAVSPSAHLTVLIPTSITQGGLVSHVAITNTPVTFGLTAFGNPLPLAFEWRRGSAPIVTNVVNARSDFITVLAPTNLVTNLLFRTIVKNVITTGNNTAATNFITTVLDTDADGLPDFWESQYGGAGDPDGDADGDLMKNRDEYLAGTNPTDATSFLRIELLSPGPGALLRFAGVSNRTYGVQFNDTLAVNTWMRLTNFVPRTNDFTNVIVDPGFNGQRFYRAVTPAQ